MSSAARFWGTDMINALTRAARALGIAAAATLALATPGSAAEDPKEPKHHHWEHAGPFGVFDRAAMQRGYQVYREVCAACHSMRQLNFRSLGQPGGPFDDPDFPNPNDNPVIKALAAEFTVSDGPDEFGDMFDRPGRPSDPFPKAFANDQMARASNGGALPPDLSVIIKARHHGEDYTASLLTGYDEEPPADVEVRPGSYWNPYFPGGQIAMAPQLFQDRVIYDDGTEATPEQLAEDVVTFLAWAAEPHQEARKRLGFNVLIYLTILAVLLWFSYKQIWRNVKH